MYLFALTKKILNMAAGPWPRTQEISSNNNTCVDVQNIMKQMSALWTAHDQQNIRCQKSAYEKTKEKFRKKFC